VSIPIGDLQTRMIAARSGMVGYYEYTQRRRPSSGRSARCWTSPSPPAYTAAGMAIIRGKGTLKAVLGTKTSEDPAEPPLAGLAYRVD